MRSYWFLACAVALVCAVGPAVDLAAGCRCNKGARKQARQERRACKRGVSNYSYAPGQQPSHYVSPYPDQVQPVGSAGDTEVVWQCQFDQYGRKIGCRPVRVPVVPTPALKPVPDPTFKVQSDSPSEATESPPEVEGADLFGEPAAFNDIRPEKAEQRDEAPLWVRELQATETEGQRPLGTVPEAPTSLVAAHQTSDPPE